MCKKKKIASIFVIVLFVVIALACSSADKISEDSARHLGYGIGRVIGDMSN